jgi:hypothetical protein
VSTITVGEAHLAIHGVEQRGEHAVEPQHRVHDFMAVRTIGVADAVNLGKTDPEKIGGSMQAELLLLQRPLHELAEELCRERRIVESGEERRRDCIGPARHPLGKRAGKTEPDVLARRIIGALHRVIDRHVLQTIPSLAEFRLGDALGIELLDPGRQSIAIVTRSDDAAVLVPVGGVAELATEKNR